MDDRALARAAARLLRGGVAPRHVRRCVEELRAHRTDLIAQLRAQGCTAGAAAAEADARLGDVDRFCAAALARPELKGWASRAPWLVFGVLPLVTFVALAVGLMSIVIGFAEIGKPAPKLLDPAVWRVGAAVLETTILWLLPVGVGGALLVIASRSRARLVWPAIGLLVLVALATAINVGLTPPAPGAKAALTAGIGYPPRATVRNLVLTALAVAGFAAVWLRLRRQSQGDALMG